MRLGGLIGRYGSIVLQLIGRCWLTSAGGKGGWGGRGVSQGSFSGMAPAPGSSHGAHRLCLATKAPPVHRLIAHSVAAAMVPHAGSDGSAHLEAKSFRQH